MKKWLWESFQIFMTREWLGVMLMFLPLLAVSVWALKDVLGDIPTSVAVLNGMVCHAVAKSVMRD